MSPLSLDLKIDLANQMDIIDAFSRFILRSIPTSIINSIQNPTNISCDQIESKRLGVISNGADRVPPIPMSLTGNSLPFYHIIGRR